MTQDAAKDKKRERNSGKDRGSRVSERNSAKNPQRTTSAAEGQTKSAKPVAPDPSKLKKLLDLISSNREYRVDELKTLLEDQAWIKELIEAFEKRDAALQTQLELERNRAARLKEEAQDFKRKVLAKLKDVTPLLEGVTKLDFSRRLEELPSDDVFAQLYAGLNLMVEDLSAMFEESKRRSEMLKESEDRYRTLQANIPVGIFRSTPGGKILSANPALVKMLGYSSEKDLLRIPVINLYADPDRRREFVKQLESKGSVTEFEAELLGRDGSKIWVWISATAVEDESGEVHYDGIIEDITKRKLAEEELKRRTEELQEREELYRALVTTAQDAILLGDPNDIILYANPSASEMLGYSEEELVGRPLFDFIPSDEKELLRSQTAQRKKGETSRYELTLIGKNGEPHKVLVTASPLFDAKGKFYASMGVFTDITDRKKTEEALRESEERFRSIYENVLIGVYRTTPDGRILMANPALVRMLGYSSFEELVEINLEDEGNHSADYKRSEFKERIEREGNIVGLETTLKRKDGTSVIVRENARVVRDEAGNTLYYEGTMEDITELSVLNEISRAISSTLDVNEIYGLIHEQLRRLINADNFYIALHDKELDEVDFVYAFQDGQLQEWGSRRAGKGMTEYVIRTGEPQLFQEDSEEEATRRGVEHIGKRSYSWLGVPMIIRDEVIGVMTVQSFDPDIMYSERHIGLMQTVANQAAQAVENARSYSELERRGEELRALFDTSTQLASTLDEQEVANIIATSAKDLIPSDGCTFYKFDEATETLLPLATTVIEGEQQQMAYNVPLGEGVTGQAAAERRPILANHVHRDPKAPRVPGTKEEPTCLLSVPLITRGELLGAITLIRMSEEEFEEHDLQLFTLFARQAASAFANSRFISRLRELNKSLEKRSEELGTLFNTSTELSSVLEEEEVASLIAQRATSLIPSNGCTFYRLDSSSEKLVPITTTVMKEYRERMAYHVPLGEGITGKAAATRRPILANHVHQDPKAPRVPGTEDVPRCLLSAPLVARGELLGAMTLVRMSEEEFTEHDLQLFTLFARQAAEAFANSRLFSQLRELNETLELKVTERTAELEQARTRLEEIHSEYKERVRARLAAIAPVMEKVSLGDFAENIPLHEEEDEFTELFVGLNLMIDDLRFMFEENRRRSEELRELNEDLKRRSAELGELLKASAAVASTLDEEEVSTLIATRATDFIGATRCTVYRFEAETNELVPQTTTSVEDKDKILTYNVPLGEGITGRAAAERKPIRANNVHKDPKAPRIPGTEERPTCLLSTPLLSKGELLGVMTLTRLSEEEFTEHDLELFTLFARQVADASANSRLLSRLKELNENLEQIVARRTAELKESSRKTADFARELEEVIYVTSHDLKTPLRAISGFSQFLYEDYREKLDAEGKLYLTRLIDSVKRMEKLLDDVLEVTAVTRTQKAFEDIQAGDLIKEAIKMVEVDEASDIIYDPDELPSVLCDRVKMVEVFYNLISNGLRFNDKPHKQVKITAQSSGGFHEFMVADNGIGIEKRHYERIFQIFQRLHQREAYEGTGVGLSMVKRVIEEHNGRVWVESQVGVGTIFHFTLPVHQDEDEKTARSERSSDG